MILNKKQLELGFSGLALLRNRLTGDKKVTQEITGEIFNLVKSLANDNLSLKEKKIKKYSVVSGYKQWSLNYDTMPNLLIEVEQPYIQSLLKKFSVGKALDAACGTGRYAKFLLSLGYKVIGVDRTAEMLSYAKKHASEASFIQGNLNKLPLEKESVDLAICSLVLTHLFSIDQAILELARVTRSGGHIILSDIHPWFVLIGGHAEFEDNKGKAGYIYNHVHLHNTYLKAFKKAGLKIDKCLEIPLKKSDIKPLKLGLNLSNNTINVALEGLPIVLVWVLEKK